jgi:hypothetical protein
MDSINKHYSVHKKVYFCETTIPQWKIYRTKLSCNNFLWLEQRSSMMEGAPFPTIAKPCAPVTNNNTLFYTFPEHPIGKHQEDLDKQQASSAYVANLKPKKAIVGDVRTSQRQMGF